MDDLEELGWNRDPDAIDLDIETCPDCDGDSDPLDDLYYCSTCKGVGWVYGEMLTTPHLSHGDVRRLAREQKEAARAGQKGAEQ